MNFVAETQIPLLGLKFCGLRKTVVPYEFFLEWLMHWMVISESYVLYTDQLIYWAIDMTRVSVVKDIQHNTVLVIKTTISVECLFLKPHWSLWLDITCPTICTQSLICNNHIIPGHLKQITLSIKHAESLSINSAPSAEYSKQWFQINCASS